MRKILSILFLSALFVFCAVGLSACGLLKAPKEPASDEYFEYMLLVDNTYELVGVKDKDNLPAKIVLPAEFNGKKVTSINDGVFADCNGLTTVYYMSTSADWNDISIGLNNDNLINATRYYYSEGYPTEFAENTYWRYVDGVPTVWQENTSGGGEYTPWVL